MHGVHCAASKCCFSVFSACVIRCIVSDDMMLFTLCILVQDHLKNVWFCSHVFCRLVSERRVPYIDIQDVFPQEMRLFGRDVEVFRVQVRITTSSHFMNQCVVFLIAMTSGFLQKLPLYSVVHREALLLAKVMKLPSFPTVSQDCLLHPLPLTVRYLLEANLPGERFWL